MFSGDRCGLKHPINATYLATEALGARGEGTIQGQAREEAVSSKWAVLTHPRASWLNCTHIAQSTFLRIC